MELSARQRPWALLSLATASLAVGVSVALLRRLSSAQRTRLPRFLHSWLPPHEGAPCTDAHELLKAVAHAELQSLAIGTRLSIPTELHRWADPAGKTWSARLATNLAKKDATTKKQNKDPFIPPFEPYQFVANLNDTHRLLLNKFNVVPRHLLVVTSEFRFQGDLDQSDFGAALRVLEAMYEVRNHVGRSLQEQLTLCGPAGLAFYNCGPASGFSQQHRHIQIVELPIDGSPDPRQTHPENHFPVHGDIAEGPVDPASDQVLGLRYACFRASHVNGVTTHGELLETWVRKLVSREQLESYNLLMTTWHLWLIPRRSVDFTVYEGNTAAATYDLNALSYSGSFFVRSEQQLDVLKRTDVQEILEGCGRSNHLSKR